MQQRFAHYCSQTVQFTSSLALWMVVYARAQWRFTVYPFLRARWTQYWTPLLEDVRPTARYFLDLPKEDLDRHLTVPPGMIYVEEWGKRCLVRYEGETIPRTWTDSPLSKKPHVPWVWVGDRDTEIDLTRMFDRFLVVGNRITNDLVSRMICSSPKTNLIFIESGTFKELKFPGDGLIIEEYGTGRPIQNSGEIHAVEETVCAPVVGGHNDKTE